MMSLKDKNVSELINCPMDRVYIYIYKKRDFFPRQSRWQNWFFISFHIGTLPSSPAKLCLYDCCISRFAFKRLVDRKCCCKCCVCRVRRFQRRLQTVTLHERVNYVAWQNQLSLLRYFTLFYISFKETLTFA